MSKLGSYTSGRNVHLRSNSIDHMRGSGMSSGSGARRARGSAAGVSHLSPHGSHGGDNDGIGGASQSAGGLYNVVKKGPVRSGSHVALHKANGSGHGHGGQRKMGGSSKEESVSGLKRNGMHPTLLRSPDAPTLSGAVHPAYAEPRKVDGKKIIFLDIDGVVHSIRVTRQEQLFNPQKMALLRKLIASTGAEIVLSSAWRRTPPTLRMVYQMLHRYGIDAPIDVTPDYGLCAKRSSEILYWVDKFQPATWVAIDDLDLNAGEPRMRPHFLKCNPLIGMTNDMVEHGISILNGGR